MYKVTSGGCSLASEFRNLSIDCEALMLDCRLEDSGDGKRRVEGGKRLHLWILRDEKPAAAGKHCLGCSFQCLCNQKSFAGAHCSVVFHIVALP